MAEKNGISKIVRIITLMILIAGILITFGVSYGNLNVRLIVVGETATKAENRSHNNRDAIISMQGDLKYIKRGIDELRGGK